MYGKFGMRTGSCAMVQKWAPTLLPRAVGGRYCSLPVNIGMVMLTPRAIAVSPKINIAKYEKIL